LDATVKNPDGTSSFSLDKFTTELKQNMFKFIISLVPNMFGMRGMIAKVMGLDYNDTTGDIKISEDPYDLNSLNELYLTDNLIESIPDGLFKNLS
jgi:Leucine-rich repeat (LRR) protein